MATMAQNQSMTTTMTTSAATIKSDLHHLPRPNSNNANVVAAMNEALFPFASLNAQLQNTFLHNGSLKVRLIKLNQLNSRVHTLICFAVYDEKVVGSWRW